MKKRITNRLRQQHRPQHNNIIVTNENKNDNVCIINYMYARKCELLSLRIIIIINTPISLK